MDSVVLFERRQMLDKWDKQIQSVCPGHVVRSCEDRHKSYNDVVAGEQCD